MRTRLVWGAPCQELRLNEVRHRGTTVFRTPLILLRSSIPAVVSTSQRNPHPTAFSRFFPPELSAKAYSQLANASLRFTPSLARCVEPLSIHTLRECPSRHPELPPQRPTVEAFTGLRCGPLPRFPTSTRPESLRYGQRLPVMASASSSNVVGVHYRVGKKIGEGSFGVIFEGQNLLNNNQVAIKFVSLSCFGSC